MKWLWAIALSVFILSGTAVASNDVIAVSDFVGSPPEIGREIAETLSTELAKSDRLNMVERAQLGKALREIQMQSAGLTEPSQVQRVGRMVGATALVVGSFHIRDGQIVINVRVIDVRTGQVIPGKAENIQGRLNDLHLLVGDLANRLHLRLTGQQLAATEPPKPAPGSSMVQVVDADGCVEIVYVVQQGWMLTDAEGKFYPDRPVSVGDFARVMSRFSAARRWEGKMELDTSRPADMVNNLRAVVVLTRLALPPERFNEQPSAQGALALLPAWARPFVHQAMQQGYIRDFQEASPQQVLTRKQLAILLSRIAPPPPTWQVAFLPSQPGSVPRGSWTGLVVDVRGLGMRPSMSPVVVDVNGRQIYPDPKNPPSVDFVQEHGIADFVKMEQQAQRAGNNPVYVRPVKVQGPSKDVVVISASDADRVLEADKQGNFLRLWRVVFVVD